MRKNIRVIVISFFLFILYSNVFCQDSMSYKVYDIDYFEENNYKVKLYRDYLNISVPTDSIKALFVTKEETLNELYKYKNIEYLSITNCDLSDIKIKFGNKLKYIRISYSKNVASFFYNIKNLNNLVSIVLKDVKITNFDFLKNASKIEKLELRNTSLKKVPNEISKCLNIKVLDLTGNKIKNIPSFIFELKQLKTLRANDNRISKFPDNLHISSSLNTVCFNLNKIKCAKELCKFTNSNIIDLFFEHCSLKEIPNCIFSQNSLQWICLSNNKIKTLPKKVNYSKQEKVLILQGNKINFTSSDYYYFEKNNYTIFR